MCSTPAARQARTSFAMRGGERRRTVFPLDRGAAQKVQEYGHPRERNAAVVREEEESVRLTDASYCAVQRSSRAGRGRRSRSGSRKDAGWGVSRVPMPIVVAGGRHEPRSEERRVG